MTSYIDYLLCYEDASARASAFPPPVDEGGNPVPVSCWDDTGRTVMPVTIAQATEDDPAVHPPGSWLAIRVAARDPEIEAMEECLLATDTALAAAGERFVIFYRFQASTPLGAVSPVFAGDAYPMPHGEPASSLDDWLIEAD